MLGAFIVDARVKIIAEAGVNHNGDFELAKKLAKIAKESGADVVKFQTFKTQNLVTTSAGQAEYQVKNLGENNSQEAMLKKLELSFEQFIQLKNYCNEIGIEFLSTGFDIDSLKFLKQIGQTVWKVPSGEVTNFLFLRYIGSFNQEVILSTGMCTVDEIEEAINCLVQFGTQRSKITLLHCTTEYPAPFEEVNLRAMELLSEKFGLAIGYSDHTSGIEVSVAAVAFGATIIEKHFTLDKEMSGPDHKASLNPEELKALVFAVRNVELALGAKIKVPTISEKKNILVARKSIVARKAIKMGEVFTEENITAKRPGTGISPMKWNQIIGTRALKDYLEDDLI